MIQHTAAEIAMAFNQQNDKKTWTARSTSTPETGIDSAYFFAKPEGVITLSYNTVDGLWTVKFNKYQSTFGDYIKAIARSFCYILSTLKSAGLPFEAPTSPAGIEIIATTGDDNTVYVRWPGAIHPIMPEVTARMTGWPQGENDVTVWGKPLPPRPDPAHLFTLSPGGQEKLEAMRDGMADPGPDIADYPGPQQML